ncbi:hypothetical protein [Aeromonas popoffii]|uniref:hypothetical protein n=1 Tax=Aeromonas popoffii TaxID=70856 RepID=UPI001427C89C|nr:hypothetical protein [Aeromonas popoffii]
MDANYLLAVKGNQSELEQAFSVWYSPQIFKAGWRIMMTGMPPRSLVMDEEKRGYVF